MLRQFLNKKQKKFFYKPKVVSNFCNNNYIGYESRGDRKRNLSLDEYLNQIKPYLRNIIIDQLAITINIISSKVVEIY